MTQRYIPHLDGAILHEERVLGGVDFVPNHLVGKFLVEVLEMKRQHFAKRMWGINIQCHDSSAKSHCGNQGKESENVVTMKMRDKDGTDFQGIDPHPYHLLLDTFSCIHEIVLFVDVDNLRRGMTIDGRLGGG